MTIPVAKARSRAEIEHIVQTIKKSINFTGNAFPVLWFLESVIPLIDPSFSYDYVKSSELPTNTYAYYDPVRNIMKIDEKVYERASNGNPRDKFTIAHEIGHYFLVDQIAFTRSETGSVPAYMNPEWQANVFAGELLIPSNEIKGLSVEEIVKIYKVSHQAAEIAYTNVNRQLKQKQ